MAHSFRSRSLLGLAVVVSTVGLGYACTARQGGPSKLTTSEAAQRVYVAPGAKDEFYAFLSGGFSGQVSVYGLPSGRRFKTIPVFSQYPENGYGYTEETKAMLNTSYGFVPWDDSHHTALSQTNGEDDGRWLFINGNNTPRIARIDLTRMETEEILEIPNAGGNHGSPFITENSEYVVASTRFSVPVPNRDVPINEFKKYFKGQISFITADKPGKMAVAFQIAMPGFNYDLARAGKGKSAPIEYMHNSIDAFTRTATSEKLTSVLTVDPKDCPGAVYFMPTPKSPHGADVDPTGEYIVAGGKLASVIPVHSFSKMLKAIEAKAFEGELDGIPVIKYEATLAGEVKNPGLGPLHTEFDGKGYAYTSMFISSEIVKWKLGTWEVVDRVPTYYSVGHLMIPGGNTRKPNAKYVVAMNKITKDRYLPTGPELTQSAQLYDNTGEKMKLLLDFPVEGEPHYANAIEASKLMEKQVKFYKLADNKNPMAVRAEKETGVSREGKKVHVRMTAIRSHFAPDNIEGVMVGDTVLFHVTNLEQDWDVPHGFAIMGNQNGELLIMPGETRTLKWVPPRAGVYPMYCTDFCSALHQEMQGYVRVSAPGSNVALTGTLSKGPSAAPKAEAAPAAPAAPAANAKKKQ